MLYDGLDDVGKVLFLLGGPVDGRRPEGLVDAACRCYVQIAHDARSWHLTEQSRLTDDPFVWDLTSPPSVVVGAGAGAADCVGADASASCGAAAAGADADAGAGAVLSSSRKWKGYAGHDQAEQGRAMEKRKKTSSSSAAPSPPPSLYSSLLPHPHSRKRKAPSSSSCPSSSYWFSSPPVPPLPSLS